MPVPVISAEQRQAALEKAKAARRERAELCGRVKRGELTLAQVFAQAQSDPDGVVARTRVLAVLKALPGFGTVRANTVAEEIGIKPTRTLRGLGPKQRQALLDKLT